MKEQEQSSWDSYSVGVQRKVLGHADGDGWSTQEHHKTSYVFSAAHAPGQSRRLAYKSASLSPFAAHAASRQISPPHRFDTPRTMPMMYLKHLFAGHRHF